MDGGPSILFIQKVDLSITLRCHSAHRCYLVLVSHARRWLSALCSLLNRRSRPTMSSRFLACVLFFAHLATAAQAGTLQKRATPFVPQRLNIPLSFDSLGRYVASVSMVRIGCFFHGFYSRSRLGSKSGSTTLQLHHDYTNWSYIRRRQTM